MTSTASSLALVLSLIMAGGEVGAFSPSAHQISRPHSSAFGGVVSTSSTLFSTQEGEEEPRLVYGQDAQDEMDSFESKLESLGTEAGYLAAAKKRQEEARAEMLREAEEEAQRAAQEEAYLREQGEWRRSENYGPGDLSGARGILVADDGWEASMGADEDNIIGAQAALEGEMGGEPGGGTDDGEEPTLFIPTGDDGDGPIVF